MLRAVEPSCQVAGPHGLRPTRAVGLAATPCALGRLRPRDLLPRALAGEKELLELKNYLHVPQPRTCQKELVKTMLAEQHRAEKPRSWPWRRKLLIDLIVEQEIALPIAADVELETSTGGLTTGATYT